MTKNRDAKHVLPRPAKKQYSFAGLAGCVIRRKSMKTGFLVGLYHAAQAGMEDDPQYPWATVCEEHNTLVCHSSLFLAREHVTDPEGWCEDCRKGYLRNFVLRHYVRIDGDTVRLVLDKSDATLIETDQELARLLMCQDSDKDASSVTKKIAGCPIAQFKFVRLSAADIEANRQVLEGAR